MLPKYTELIIRRFTFVITTFTIRNDNNYLDVAIDI
jgi:hypothetical protein